MKKVAGTLKLAQAEYRELEAFSKFGSDLDAATKNILDKGARNVEILKQPQYSPVPVEKQIAIIACGTRGLLQKLPVSSIHDFEVEFLHTLEVSHKELLADLKQGKLDDQILAKIDSVAKDTAAKYIK
jgi:F-type H+-transporting ATPase subunit alpha